MEEDVSLRYKGYGFAWQQDGSLLGKMFAKDKFNSEILQTILSKRPSSEFLINRLKSLYLPTSSVKVNCIQGQPFDIYVMLSPRDELIWCEIHVHSLPAPWVFISKMLQNPGDCPANYYLTESLPGLKLYAISPPQNEHFVLNDELYGIAIIATRFETHKYSNHSHKPGEKEGGMLIPAASEGEGGYLDDVLFHGEIVDLKEHDFYGRPILEVGCKLDFGNRGRLTIPILIQTQQDSMDPLKKGVYIIGAGSLQLFEFPKTDSEMENKTNARLSCNKKPWWKFWGKERPLFPQVDKKTQESPAELRVGGVYSVIQGNKEFRIAKLLVLEEGIAHIRLYKNKFSKRPDEINLSSLTLGTIHDKDGFGMGHLPIPEHDFLSWQPKLLVQTDVNEEELEGYKIYKENNGTPFSF